MIVKRVLSAYRGGGVLGVARSIVRRILMPRARCFPVVREAAEGAIGLEIGGPSPIFERGGLLPLYPLAERIDNCNFAQETIWGSAGEKTRAEFKAGRLPGRHFIAEGSDPGVSDRAYRFLASSHMLEHSANPLRALSNWRRLVEPGGKLILVLPHRDGTFDQRRPVTTLEHLIRDFEASAGEDDTTHIPEALELHDLSRDAGCDPMLLRERLTRNFEFRSLHHHVFDTRLALAAVTWAGFEVLTIEPLRPYHIIVVAQVSPGRPPTPFSSAELDKILSRSPFPTDRK